MKLETENLILYPLTSDLIDKLLNQEITDYSSSEWLTEDNKVLITWMKDELYSFIPPQLGFTSWIFIEKSSNQIIGDGGYKGNPNHKGEVEIGYEIIPSKRKKGYATEAINALIDWAITKPEVRCITAKCAKYNIPSQNLLQKLQFAWIETEDEMEIYHLYIDEHPLFKLIKFFIVGLVSLGMIVPLIKKCIKKASDYH